MNRANFKAYMVGGFLAASALSGPLRAQVADASAEGQADPVAGKPAATGEPQSVQADGDIIVTAQRRSESLQRTPVAVTVLGSDTLVKRAITSETDLQSISPGLSVRSSQNSNQLNYAIRGQSLDPFSNTRPGVLPYVNEIQVGGGGGGSAFYDLQSIQVLKGPQGTLFGRNATGGAVLFTTAKPTDEFEGYAMGRVGNYDLRHVEGAINAPIVEGKVLARIAGFFQKRDGFQRNLTDGRTAGDIDRKGVRGSLTFEPAEAITNELVVDYYRAKGNSTVGLIYSLSPNGALPVIALTNFGNAAQFEGIISAFVAGAGGPPNAGAGAAAAYAAANPNLDPGGIASYLNTQLARGPYKFESEGPNRYRGRNVIISNITSFDLGPDTKLRNVLGYTRIDSANFNDLDGTPYGIDGGGDGGIINRTRQFSDEVQILGKVFDGNFSYVVGAYFSKEKNFNITTSKLLQFPIIGQVQTSTSNTRNETYAGYGQGTYDLSDATGIEGLGVTIGARYTSEKIKLEVLPGDVSFLAPPAKQATFEPLQDKTYNNLSWTLGVQEQLNSSLLLYAVSRRSYRNGGYNVAAPPIPGLGNRGGNGYGVETVTDGEIGLKFQGYLGGMLTRFNIDAYQNWVKNAQQVAFTLIDGTPAAITVNVPRAKVRGFEFDGQINPTTWLRVGGAANFTDAKYTSNLVSVAGGPPIAFGTYSDVPKLSGAAFTEIVVPVSPALTASLRGDVYAQTHTHFSSTGNLYLGTRLPGYRVVNFRAGIEDESAGWSVSATVKNAFDRTYYAGGNGVGPLFQMNTAVPGERRTFLVELRSRF